MSKEAAMNNQLSAGAHRFYGRAAGVYADEARKLARRMEAANKEASHAIFLMFNPNLACSIVAAGGDASSDGEFFVPLCFSPAAAASASGGGGVGAVVDIDLHGQHAEEAVALLDEHIFPQAAKERTKVLHIITGRGSHTPGGGGSPVKAAVGSYLESIQGRALVIASLPTSTAVHKVEHLESSGGFRVCMRHG